MQIKYSCEKCRFSTKDLEKYKNHVSLHNDIKFACSHCTHVSYTKGDFQRHLVTHTGKFPYSCEYCGYGAIRNDYIIKHKQRIHGNGLIQCSVSVTENDIKNASVNIIETSVQSNVQEFSQRLKSESIKPSRTAKVTDLTTNIGNRILPHKSNGLPQDGQVSVEVISPVTELHPGMPLTVFGPSLFELPPNCFAQILEVRPVNNTHQLILKFFEQNGDTKNINTFEEQKPFCNVTEAIHLCEDAQSNKVAETVLQTSKLDESMDISLLQADSLSITGCHRKSMQTIETENVSNTKENSNTDHPRSPENKQSFLESLSEQSIESINDVLEGPFISSVFSLCPGSSSLAGIQWSSCPKSTREENLSKGTVDRRDSPQACTQSAKIQHDLNKNEASIDQVDLQIQQHLLQNGIHETITSNAFLAEKNEVKEKSDVNLWLPLGKPVLSCDRKSENPASILAQRRSKRQRKLSHKDQFEIDFCTKPHTLFLSCDKSVIMQPVSCATQTDHKNAKSLLETKLIAESNTCENMKENSDHNRTIEKPADKNHKLLKKREPQTLSNNTLLQKQALVSIIKNKETCREKSSYKKKGTTLLKSQRTLEQKKTKYITRSLRLTPAKTDQLIQNPDYNQPIVVLNHPDVESLEIFHIMKAVNKFKGKVLKVTLRKGLI
ncbi:zinc finger protein 518B isoform 2-T2 [Discoglossus pictus]